MVSASYIFLEVLTETDSSQGGAVAAGSCAGGSGSGGCGESLYEPQLAVDVNMFSIQADPVAAAEDQVVVVVAAVVVEVEEVEEEAVEVAVDQRTIVNTPLDFIAFAALYLLC